MGLGASALAAPGLARAEDDPSAGKYPAKRNDKFGEPDADHGREARDDLQQLLRIRHRQEHLAGRAEAADPSVDDQGQRQGREAVRDRLRRPARQDAARGARLPPPLRRDLVDDRAVVGLPAEVAGRVLQARRQSASTSSCRRSPNPKVDAGPEGFPLSRGPTPRAWRWTRRRTISPSSRPASTASRSPSRTARRCASWRRGSTASRT